MSDNRKDTGVSNKMWGGRFAEGPSAIMREINASIPFDKVLWRQDITASRAHAAMLAAQGIISAEDAATIDGGLDQIAGEYERDGVPEDWDLEDIHMTTEARLAALVGPAAGRLHTARSRNDQVATDFRMWVRAANQRAIAGIDAVLGALVTRAEEHADSIMPGFTHLQTAQPVTLGHHLLAYFEMLMRDRSRFADALDRMDECPLGSAALAGTGFDLDRDMTAEALGFAQPTRNVSTRSRTATSRSTISPRPASARCISAGSRKSSSSGPASRSASSSCPIRCPPAVRSCRRSAIPMPPNWCAGTRAA